MGQHIITPEASLNPGQLKQLRDYVAAVLQDVVHGSTQQNTVIRPLNPTDAAGGTATALFTNPVQVTLNTVPPAAQYPTWTLKATQAVAIFGYAATAVAPQFDELWLGTAATYAKIRLTPLYAQGSARSKVGYFNPVWFVPNDNPVIGFVAGATVGIAGETYELIGLVAEQANQSIANQPQVSSRQLPTTNPISPFAS